MKLRSAEIRQRRFRGTLRRLPATSRSRIRGSEQFEPVDIPGSPVGCAGRFPTLGLAFGRRSEMTVLAASKRSA